MKMISDVAERLQRTNQIGGAFMRIDYIDTMNYPLALIMRGITALVPIVTFYFVSHLMAQNGPEVAFDYYTFVVIGIVALSVLGSTLTSFGNMMLRYVQEGQLEMFLVEPIRWSLLPFATIPWQAFLALVTAIFTAAMATFLGASYLPSGIPIAMLIVFLGLAATLSIGILSASLKVLAKRTDPVLAIYSIAASVLSGAFYPIELLPSWLRTLSWLIPHTYVIQALRRVLMPQGEVLSGPTSLQAIGALTLFCLVMYPIALWIFNRTLDYGRKIGALSGY
jgi:ABC-2 type transport system permease protein